MLEMRTNVVALDQCHDSKYTRMAIELRLVIHGHNRGHERSRDKHTLAHCRQMEEIAIIEGQLGIAGRNAQGGSTRRGPHPPRWSVQGKVAARGKRNRRPRPRGCSEGHKTGSNAKDKAEEMQGGREVDEAKETQGGKDKDGAEVQQRNRPMDEAGVMQRSSREDKAGVQQRSEHQDEAAER